MNRKLLNEARKAMSPKKFLRRIYETSLDDIGLSATCGIVLFSSQFTAVTFPNSLLGSNDTNFFSADVVFAIVKEAE